jgi:hypothetical protein
VARIDRCRVEHFDIDTGLHGDHIGGVRAAVEALRTQACSTASGRSTTFPGSRSSMPARAAADRCCSVRPRRFRSSVEGASNGALTRRSRSASSARSTEGAVKSPLSKGRSDWLLSRRGTRCRPGRCGPAMTR